MTTGIVGNGAIGNLLAYQLAQSSHDYCLLTRTGEALTLQVTDQQGQTHRLTPKCYPVTKPPPLDCLVLPLKAYQVIPALEQIGSGLSKDCRIVLLHNGMGSIEAAIDLLPNHLIVAATTSYGAYKPDPQHCMLTGSGETHAGIVSQISSQDGREIRRLLTDVLPPCHWHNDVARALWYKLAINAAINPLTALHGVKNGALAGTEHQHSIATICREVAEVMSASGYPTDQQTLSSKVMQVIFQTADNYSSMHQDILYNRPTEIDFITGYVVKKADALGISVPLNHQLLCQIKQLQSD